MPPHPRGRGAFPSPFASLYIAQSPTVPRPPYLSLMSTSYPVRIPASAFTSPRRRKPSLKNYGHIPPVVLKPTRISNADDVYVPRPPTFMSISFLREAISTIDVKMMALVKERAELETKLETAVRLQSPVLRLPSELLSSIFSIGVLGMGDKDPVMVPTLMLVWCVA